MTANTGYNDPGSVYNSGLLSWTSGLSDAAAKIITAVKGPITGADTNSKNANIGNPTSSNPTSKWLWIGGAVLAVVALVWFLRK